MFHTNKCKYHGCQRNYASLNELIYHIEEYHLDFDPATVEEMETQIKERGNMVPLSYVLKFSSGNHHRERSVIQKRKVEDCFKIENEMISNKTEIYDDPRSDNYSSDVVYMLKKPSDSIYPYKKDSMCRIKRFACPIPGCNKRYKNINGIKYHTKNGHDLKKSQLKSKKTHKCQCGKAYKTAQGLKTHTITHKEVISVHRYQALYASHPMPTSHMFNPYARHEMMNMIHSLKKEVFEDDIFTHSYLEQVPKLSDTVEIDNNNFVLFNPPYPHNTLNFNENFVENFVIDEQSNQNYSFSFTCRKY